MSSETTITSRPSLPVRPVTKVTIAPPRPPSLPGAKTRIAPPRVPGTAPHLPASQLKDPAKTAEIERRREALAGSGVGDPKSTVEMILTGAKNNARALPLIIKRYWWLILIVGGVWIFCQSFDPEIPGIKGINNPRLLKSFYNAIKPGVNSLVFLTAAYNGWVAKSVYGLVILKIFVPLVQRIRADGFKTVMDSFSSVVPGIKSSWAASGDLSLSLFIFTAGTGVALTNLLSGNNSYTRCIASVALALSMVKFLSDSKKSLPFMAARVVSKDIFKTLRKENPVKNHHIFVGITGVMTGLSTSIIFALIVLQRGYPGPVEFAGYWIGLAAIVASVVLYFVKARGKQSPGQSAGQV